MTSRLDARVPTFALGEYLSLAGISALSISLVLILTPSLGAQPRCPLRLVSTLNVLQEFRTGDGGQTSGPRAESKAKQAAQGSAPATEPGSSDQSDDHAKATWTKRILGIIPNFQAVSVDTYLPPLSVKQKFWIATQNSFDYSAFISVGIQAGVEETTNTYPEFRQGAAGFGRYYWHTFADQAVGNYVVGAIFPSITHEDSRFYILNRGGFWHRAVYAFSRIVITRNDAGGRTFNISEIAGNASVAAISPLYYPSQERNWNEYGERWATSVIMDGVFNLLQEFWPDINHKILHRH